VAWDLVRLLPRRDPDASPVRLLPVARSPHGTADAPFSRDR